ncbi:MAG TPA: hypothetical protein PLF40_13040 [Kofleriaceae bacterium]|nr:hypothetical protein [Kofleriaceae bacterium]
MARVLFIHGLESGPTGHKVRVLQAAGFDVVSMQMPCGRNAVLRDPVLWLIVAAAAAVVGGAAVTGGGWLAVVALIGVFLLAPFARAGLTRRMFRRSIAVQQHALLAHQIDVVVGSSWGGAVGLALLQREMWCGPTVLLCPAHQLVAQRAMAPRPTGLAALPPLLAKQVVVVHGRQDDIVPVAHSEALVADSASKLFLVDDDHRLSATATKENLAAWVAHAFGSRSL